MSPWWWRSRPREYLANTMDEIAQRRLLAADDAASQADAPPADLLLVVQAGETAGGRTVSVDLLERLVQATKQPALEALDRYFGTDAWCPKITTNCSVEGPVAYFTLYLVIQHGETQASMAALVDGEFRRRWSAAAQQLLA